MTGRNGDGTGPQPSSGQAQITALSPSSVAAASGPFTLSITGLNFVATTTAIWDGHVLPTTFVSSTSLRAEVPASYVQLPGTVSVVPSPQGGFNFGSTFSVVAAPASTHSSFTVSRTAVQANDMVWSASNARLYLSGSAADPQYASTIVALDPQTGQFGASQKTATSPGLLSASADGSYLYAAFGDTFSVRRYALPAIREDLTIPLGVGSDANYRATDLQVQPGAARTVAVARRAADVNYRDPGDVVIFDDGTARPQAVRSGNSLQIATLLWALDGRTLFGTDEVGTAALYTIPVDASGTPSRTVAQAATSLTGNLHLGAAGDLLYLNGGSVLNARDGSSAGFVPVNAVQGGFNQGTLMTLDPGLKIAYFLGRTINSTGSTDYVIEAFDLSDLHLLGVASLSGITGKPTRFLRWGDQGLAFLTTDTTGGGKGAVYLVSGSFVTHPTL